jgi:UDP-N-acetylglucosamine 2-epimerase (hydrolysing)
MSQVVKRKILFLTGTRADFGKLKPLISKMSEFDEIELSIFVTGMHMMKLYGSTWKEVQRNQFGDVYCYVNQNAFDTMDSVLAKTIVGLSDFVKENRPDLVVIHGDRVEALAGAIVSHLNTILVAHIEGGEVSGTLDESMRHAVTKLSHLHFVANCESRARLIQLGESPASIYVIGSPEIDVMQSDSLPSLAQVKKKYEINFENYSLLLFHPVATELADIAYQVEQIVKIVRKSGLNWLVIMPNNDEGSFEIQRGYKKLEGTSNVRILPSMRFEYYLTALRNADFIMGNSSSGVRESGFYGVPCINLGTRQSGRSKSASIIHTGFATRELQGSIRKALSQNRPKESLFGDGKSADRFSEALLSHSTWITPLQKQFFDLEVPPVQ